MPQTSLRHSRSRGTPPAVKSAARFLRSACLHSIALAAALSWATVAPFDAQAVDPPGGGETRQLTGVTLELVSEFEGFRPGEPFSVGLRVRHHEGFHSYWKAPGIVGVPWMLDWELPPGFEAGPIRWPAPELVKMFHYDAFGYESDTLLVVEINPPAVWETDAGGSPRPATLKARASWMACADTCHPDSVELSLTVPAVTSATGPLPDPRWADAFAAARASMPLRLPASWTTWTLADADGFLVHFQPPEGTALPEQAVVMPDVNLIDSVQPQSVGRAAEGRAFTVRLNRLPDMHATPPVLSGLLRLPDRRDHHFASPVSARPLDDEGLSAFRSPVGDWVRASRVALDSADPRMLTATDDAGGGAAFNGRTGITSHLVTRQEFGDCRVHLEFMVSQGSNSGVYLMGRYEVQILDSHGKPAEALTHGDSGGIYERWDEDREPKGFDGVAPPLNAALAAGRWQTLDIVFRAPQFGPDREKSSDAEFAEVVLNGTILHRNVRVGGPTRAAMFGDEAPAGPLMIQGDHGPIAIRNLVIEPLDLKEAAGPAR